MKYIRTKKKSKYALKQSYSRGRILIDPDYTLKV